MTPEQVQRMTKDERRDWLAEAMGWSKTASAWSRGGFAPEMDMEPYYQQQDHPIPDTLDAAAKCLPEGWVWSKRASSARQGKTSWFAWHQNDDADVPLIELPATDDETNDRFALAILAISADGHFAPSTARR